MLFALRDYIVKQKRVGIKQVSRAFNLDVTALEAMLDVWICRGVIKRDIQRKACSDICSGCSYETTIYYYSI